MEKPREIALGDKSEENKVIKGRFADGGGGCAPAHTPPPPFSELHTLLLSLSPLPPCFSELLNCRPLLLSLSSTTIRVVANATTRSLRLPLCRLFLGGFLVKSLKASIFVWFS